MTTFAIAVRTVQERADMLGAQLWRDLGRAVTDSRVVGLHVSAQPGLTPNRNAVAAIASALLSDPDWIIFLEDDAELLDDFIGSTERWLADHSRDDVHVYPLGCQYPLPNTMTWMEYPLAQYYCSVGLVLRKSMALSLVQYVTARPALQGFDLLLAKWHQSVSSSTALITPVPCYVEHTGDDSTLIETRSMRNAVGRFQGWRGKAYTYDGERLDG